MKSKKHTKYLSFFFTFLLIFPLFSPYVDAREPEAADDSEEFKDVDLYKDEINFLVARGIIKGYEDGTFRPNEPVKRLQAIQMIIREMGLDTTNRPDPNFQDVTPGSYGYDVIATAVDEGIISGKNNGTIFDPYGNLTRAQMAKILVNAYNLEGKSDQDFLDIDKNHWAYDYISTLAYNKITTGYEDQTFRPLENIKRSHFALFLTRYIQQNESDLEKIENSFEIIQSKEKVKSGEKVEIEVKVKDEDLKYQIDWEAAEGDLKISKDTKKAEWSIKSNQSKGYTVTVSIEVELKNGEKHSFSKSISIQVNRVSTGGGGSSSGSGGGGNNDNPSPTDPPKDPSIVITNPTNEDVYISNVGTITLKGTLQTTSTVDKIFYWVLDEKSEKPVHSGEIASNKNWEIRDLPLTEGNNTIVVRATDDKGNNYEDILEVVFFNDEDEDGLSLQQEEELGLDPKNPDSDGDGLPDGYELFITNTNPASTDTNDNGFLDSQEDPDNDGLTNLEEFELGTDPLVGDSDKDGLSDGVEVLVHKTNPLLEDTDGDGLLDDSEFKLEFDPLLPDTDGDGIIDSEELTLQTLDSNLLSDIITDDNLTVPEIIVNGKGDINRSMMVTDASEDPVISRIPGLVGKPLSIEHHAEFDHATITFQLKPELLNGRDINEFGIIWYDEENNKVVPQEITINEDEQTISTNVNHFSVYAVIDFIKWFHEIEGDTPSAKLEKGKADIVFVIDSTGSMYGAINNVKSNINSFVDTLEEEKVDVRLGLIDYKDIDADGPHSTRNLGWFEDTDDFRNKVNSLSVTGGGDTPESAVDALEEARRMGFAENRAKFIILLTDADYHEKTRFEGLNTMEEEINRLVADNIVASVITSPYVAFNYDSLVNLTGGVSADIYGDFSGELNKLIEKIKYVTHEQVTVRLTTGTVRLDKEPDKSDIETDTDKDGVPDSEELTELTSCYDGKGEFVECWNYVSNPALPDSDFDGYSDAVDAKPLEEYSASIMFVHGWTADSKDTFGVGNKISSKEWNDNAVVDEGLYVNIENQRILHYRTGELFGEVYTTAKKASRHTNLFAFNYPNLAHPEDSAELLNKYINKLVEAGQLQRPMKGTSADNKPEVAIIAHSMGGLVSRQYHEKISESSKKAKVVGITTLATPHWGASGLGPMTEFCLDNPKSGICHKFSGKTEEMLSSPAAKALHPTPTKMEYINTIDGYYPVRMRVKSWTEGLNDGFTNSTKKGAKYFAVGGVYNLEDNVTPIELRFLVDEGDVDGFDGSFEKYAKKLVKEHDTWGTEEPTTYDDGPVNLDSALGSSSFLGNDGHHVEDHVLNIDDRYVVIGKEGETNHSPLVHYAPVMNTVKYWLYKDLFSVRYGEYFDNRWRGLGITEPEIYFP